MVAYVQGRFLGGRVATPLYIAQMRRAVCQWQPSFLFKQYVVMGAIFYR